MRNLLVVMLTAPVLYSTSASAQPVTPRASISNAYASFEFLIVDWKSGSSGGVQLRQAFRWGPGRAYILYSTYLTEAGKLERLHFEGIMVWNGRTNALDYVFAVEPGSGVQEKGIVTVQPDGSVVRAVELTDATGKVGHFRQTFQRTGVDSAVTSLMRKTETGWEPNFPGSEKMEMKRLPD
jgi:hypothetical protein